MNQNRIKIDFNLNSAVTITLLKIYDKDSWENNLKINKCQYHCL